MSTDKQLRESILVSVKCPKKPQRRLTGATPSICVDEEGPQDHLFPVKPSRNLKT